MAEEWGKSLACVRPSSTSRRHTGAVSGSQRGKNARCRGARGERQNYLLWLSNRKHTGVGGKDVIGSKKRKSFHGMYFSSDFMGYWLCLLDMCFLKPGLVLDIFPQIVQGCKAPAM